MTERRALVEERLMVGQGEVDRKGRRVPRDALCFQECWYMMRGTGPIYRNRSANSTRTKRLRCAAAPASVHGRNAFHFHSGAQGQSVGAKGASGGFVTREILDVHLIESAPFINIVDHDGALYDLLQG